jgi:rhodanese-related sulfurtransferase
MTADPAPRRSRISLHLDEVRRRLDRVPLERLDDELAAGALLVDIRPVADRNAEGELPGAAVIERNVLEWRLDPTSPDRLPGLDGDDARRIILCCNDGYASSLAAAQLHDIGLTGATDLVGGYRAWRRRASGPPD